MYTHYWHCGQLLAQTPAASDKPKSRNALLQIIGVYWLNICYSTSTGAKTSEPINRC